MEEVYIFGHKNPDTDTICSAIAYAYLKNTVGPGRYVPARLGELNQETTFVLDRFNVPPPALIPHVHMRAQDVMTSSFIAASTDATVYEVGELMRSHEVHAIPILDPEGRPLGVVTERSLTRGYLKELEVQSLADTPTPLSRICDTLNATLIEGDPDILISGNAVIGAMSPETMVRFIEPGDIVISGNRENAQQVALTCDISCLIITGGFEPTQRIRKLARARGAAILLTPYDTFGTARRINLSVTALSLMEVGGLTVTPDSLVTEVTPDLLESKDGIALVTDHDGQLVGVLTKSDILTHRRRHVILVDHSERSQSADGIERAQILEIIDHHRLGGLETAGPIMALIAPVGCTATLVLRRFRELNVVPPADVAGLLTSAILSDTMLLKSPTTTDEDRSAIDFLAPLLGEEPLEFGREMYRAKSDIARLSPAEVAATDRKAFVFGSAKVAIGQVEVGDKEQVLAHKEAILEAMAQHQRDKGYDLVCLMVTDILREGTELLVIGKTRAVERAFDKPVENNAVYLPGVLSRKQQIVPPLSVSF